MPGDDMAANPFASPLLRRRSDRAAIPVAADEDAGKLLLRVTIGGLILLHGFAKLRGGVDPIAGMLAQHGLPGVLAYLAYVGEVLAPVAMILGIWTRPAALVVAFNMLVAIALAHAGDVAKLSDTGGWAIELQAAYLFGACAVALTGAGRYSVAGITGRWN